jgi:hypothetical protein
MDIEYFHNPLAYDDKLLYDKLDEPVPRTEDINSKMELMLVQEKVKKQEKELLRKNIQLENMAKQSQKIQPFPTREHFTSGGCGCSVEGFKSNNQEQDDTKKLLIFMVVVLLINYYQ